MRCGGGDQVLPAAAHPAAHRPRQPAPLPPQARRQLEAGRIDEPREGRDGGLALPDSYALITLA